MENYIPPFEITNEMMMKISSIMEKIGKLDNYTSLNKRPYLRKQNRINSIHSSLAIENNSLSLDQVKDVIDGKTVIGPQKEIQEVKNAYKAYEMITDINPYSINDLLKVHGVMTYLTVNDAGNFRKENEGVFDGDNCIFVCPPPNMVSQLIKNLFDWLNKNKDIIHPLILSSVFHYEFVFIHPFSYGNGRTVRLWQNALLYNWKEIFLYLPIESQIRKYQADYYKAINDCHINGNSNVFINFMLKMIDETLTYLINRKNVDVNQENINIDKILNVMEKDRFYSATELMQKLNIKSRETLRNKYLTPAIEQKLIKQTNPDKITSKNQQYYKI